MSLYYYIFVTGDILRGEPNEPIALNWIIGSILCGTFVETTQTNSSVTYLFRANTLRNKVGGITIERNPSEFDLNNNYDTKERMFLKDEQKYVFEDFEGISKKWDPRPGNFGETRDPRPDTHLVGEI